MYKIKELFNYLIILIIVSFFVIGNSNYISHIILSNLRKEFVPVISINQESEFSLVDEIFPARVDDNGTITYEKDTDDIEAPMDNFVDSDNEAVTGTYLDADKTVENIELENTEEISVEASTIPQVIPDNIGITYSMEQLNDFEFLIGNCYTIDGSTSITSEDINIETMLAEDLSMDISGDEYKVLIYHSHGSETFINSRPGVTEDSIIGVGDELTRILEEDYGIKTYHDRTVYDVVDGKLDRNYAYTASGYGIDKILEQYPSIEVVLDVHRDGVRDDVHLMKVIDGKPTAQIMFFNGISRLNDEGELGYLHNPNRSSNLSFSLQMHLKGKELYGDLMRKIYIGGYCYNLDRKPRASLIEVGAQTNTVEEAKNAMIPLAAILYSVLKGD